MSMDNFKRRLSLLPPWSLTAIGLLVILWMTLAPHPLGEEELPLFPGADKIAHAVMFGGFSLLILLDETRRNAWKPISRAKIWGAFATSALLGLIVEICQLVMELGRSFEWLDFVADSTGALLACLLWTWGAHKLSSDR